MWKNWNPCALLVRMQNGGTVIRNSMKVISLQLIKINEKKRHSMIGPRNIKNRITV